MKQLKRKDPIYNFTLTQSAQVSKALFSYGYVENEEFFQPLFNPIRCREYLNEITQQYCGYKRHTEEYVHGFGAGKLEFRRDEQLYLYIGQLTAALRDTIIAKLAEDIPDFNPELSYGIVGGGFIIALPDRFYTSSFMMALITNHIRNIERFGSTENLYRYAKLERKAGPKAWVVEFTGAAFDGSAELSFVSNILRFMPSVDDAVKLHKHLLQEGGELLWGREPDLSKMGGYEVHGRGICASWRNAHMLSTKMVSTPRANACPSEKYIAQYTIA